MPSLMESGGGATPLHASPFGKGRCHEVTEGIRANPQKSRHLLLFFADTKCGAVSDVIHRTDTVSPLRSPWSCTYVVHSRRPLRRLLVPSATDARNFGCSCLFEVRGQELCPIGAKREGKPRFSGAALRAHAVVSPLNLSASTRCFCFAGQKKSNEIKNFGINGGEPHVCRYT